MIVAKQSSNKSALARELGISRSLLYYKHKKDLADLETKLKIEAVLRVHPAYGHKRIAPEVRMNKKKVLRVMNKFGIKSYRQQAKRLIKKNDLGKQATTYPNLIQSLPILYPNQVWCTDFTYLRHNSSFLYLATVIDLFTRAIVGFCVSSSHDRFLVINALLEALRQGGTPEIIHSDQGSEYDSADFINLVQSQNLKVSMSTKGSPWQNGYQESFYGKFKAEFGDPARFDTAGELIEYIYHQIHYYNYQRRHSSLNNITPNQFKINYLVKNQNKTTELLS